MLFDFISIIILWIFVCPIFSVVFLASNLKNKTKFVLTLFITYILLIVLALLLMLMVEIRSSQQSDVYDWVLVFIFIYLSFFVLWIASPFFLHSRQLKYEKLESENAKNSENPPKISENSWTSAK